MLIEVLCDGQPVLAKFVVVVGFDGEFVEDAEHGSQPFNIQNEWRSGVLPTHTTCLQGSQLAACRHLLQYYALQLNVCNVPESPSQAWKAGSDQVVPWLLATCILAL